MGVIWSRLRRKKTTVEVLEGIDQEMNKLEQFRRKNQERHKKFVATLMLYSILFYIVTMLVFYFKYFPDRWKDRFIYSLPLLLFPFLIWFVKKGLHWYFVKRTSRNDLALEELREKKKEILEEVMEKETYKKAKEILEKFDPERYKDLEKPKNQPVVPGTPGTELRQRQPQQRSPPGSQMVPGLRPGMTPQVMGATPMRPQHHGLRPGMTPYGPRSSGPGIQPRNLMEVSGINGTPQGPPLPRPILPRERSVMDRMLEYLVGDGPQNRYALICRNCHSHNGMALKEEFEYIEFRCCYCHIVNPARKKRPYAPRIEPPVVTKDDVENEGEDGESEGEEYEDQEGGEGGNDEEEVVQEGGDKEEQFRLEESMDLGEGQVGVGGTESAAPSGEEEENQGKKLQEDDENVEKS